MSQVAKKTSISIPRDLLRRGKEKAKRDGFRNSFSAYIQKLVSDDVEGKPKPV